MTTSKKLSDTMMVTYDFTFDFLNIINPLQPGVAFLYPLKTSENLKVF